MTTPASTSVSFLSRPAVAGGWLAVLTLVFCWRCYRTFDIFSNTTDEPAHIACGLEVWQSGRYTLEPQHPPLARVIVALPAYLAGLRQHDFRIWERDDLAFYWRTLGLARMGNLVFAPFLLVGVYWWARHLYDSAAGLAAATLVSLCPHLLAHASLATLDFGSAVTTFLAAYGFWRWSLARNLRSCLLAAAAFAAAVATKFSALFFLPPLALVFFLISLRQRPVTGSWSRPAIVRQSLAFLETVALLVWGAYLFDFGPLPAISIYAPPRTLGQYYASALEVFVALHRVPAPAFWRGLADVLAHNSRGHLAYLLGRTSQTGWWFYFPVALAVKTTLPLMLLSLTGLLVAVFRRNGASARGAIYPIAAAAVVLAVSMGGGINIGIRHVLVIFPFLAVAGAVVFFRPAARGRRLGALGLLLVLWQAAESFHAHPDYLAYFNQIARGRELNFLADSNLDWGQDLERLRRDLLSRHVDTVYLAYSGAPAEPPLRRGGVSFFAFDVQPPPAGWVAVSVNRMVGLPDKYPLFWLGGQTPVARIGKSILLYHLSEQQRQEMLRRFAPKP
jgi:hypothetical protein